MTSRVVHMESASKIQVFLFVVFSVVILYNVIPSSKTEELNDIEEIQQLLPDFCKICVDFQTCFSAYGFITLLNQNCGNGKPLELKKIVNIKNDIENIITINKNEQKTKKEVKKSNLMYEIIIALLLISVTLSLADCFQERKRRKLQNLTGVEMTMRGGKMEICNRRMSLADLTISRHARKESQASYRPPAGPRLTMGRRSSSHESPQNKLSQVSRQTSCPQPFLRRLSTVDLTQEVPEDGGWAEKRRVRMIQRH